MTEEGRRDNQLTNDSETVVFLSEHVFGRNFYIVESNISGTGGGTVSDLDGTSLQTLLSRHEEDGKTLFTGSSGDGKVVSVHSSSDPLFNTVDDAVSKRYCRHVSGDVSWMICRYVLVLPVWRLDGGGLDTSDVTTSIRLGDGQTNVLFLLACYQSVKRDTWYATTAGKKTHGLSGESVFHDLVLEMRLGKVDDGRQTNDSSTLETIGITTC